nr:hypothetical protein [Tanacetum cinerariifolium]
MCGLKECSSCGALYTKSCGCSKRGFIDKYVRDPNKTPDSSERPPYDCPSCGSPVDGLYCRHCTLLRKKLKEKIPLCYDDDDDEESSIPLRDIIISELPLYIEITPVLSTDEPKDSLIMRDEHLSTIPKKESDKFIKSSVKNLVPQEIISSEFNLIHNEDLDSTPKNDRFDTKSYLLESLLNRDTLMASSPKFDSLLEELFGELTHIDLIPPGINEANYDPEEDIHLVERLLYDNSSPRPPKEFNSKNTDTIIESFSPSPIPVKDSDPFMKKIDLFLASDGSIPSVIDNDYSDFEGDNLFLERLLHDDPIPHPDILDFSNVV